MTTAAPTDLTGIAGWAVDVMDKLGPVGAGLLSAAETAVPVIPSEVVLPVVGFTAGTGRFSLAAALVSVTVGSVLGAVVLYYVGALIGRERVYWIGERLPLIKTEDIARTEEFFHKHGSATVFVGRFLPVFRVLISLPAGITRMPVWKFALFSALGSGIWNTIFVLLGYKLGEHWDKVEPVMHKFQNVFLAAVAVVVVAWVVHRIVKSRRPDTEAADTDALV